MTKDAIRAELRVRRRGFVAALGEKRLVAEQVLADRLLPLLAGCAAVAFYRTAGSEIDPAAALAMLVARGGVAALPRITADGAMRFCRWSPGDPLVTGPFGTEQPDKEAAEIVPAVIVAPLVGFARSGERLGQGGGFYDRAFAAHPSARRIGVAWSVQEVDALPLDPWDVPLHLIVTERELIEIPS